MKTRGAGIVGYNVQTAAEAKHHLIVAHEVTNEGHDRAQLKNMATQAKDAMAAEELTIVADRGYFNGKEIKACEDAGIKTYLPKCQTSGNQAKGLFGRRDFIYKSDIDEYVCPAGERVIYRFSTQEKGKTIRVYWSASCVNCSMKPQCTTSKHRRISRWEHEAVLDVVEARTEREPERMKARRNTVEHPYGTIKLWMGYTHFQTRTLERVSAEMSLHVLAYNLKRVMNIMGIGALIEAMQA
jgi:transposase